MIVQEKVPGGKMIAADFDIAEGRISRIKITGDFFLHPEDTLIKIEEALIGETLDNVESKVTKILSDNNAKLIGVEPKDIQIMLKKVIAL
jgi:lipoate-protein ligase A